VPLTRTCHGSCEFRKTGDTTGPVIMVLTRQGRQVSSSVLPFLPLFLRASVVHGKKRGGKELGIPTGKITLLHRVYKQCLYEAGLVGFANMIYREVQTGNREEAL